MVADLPDDLVAYLSTRSPPTIATAGYGVIEMIPVAELRVEVLNVTPTLSPFADTHPHGAEFGQYLVPAVNLIRLAPNRGFPTWLFLWLPNERRYGSFDLDHGDLIIFASSVTWSASAAAPEPYVRTSAGVPDERVPLEYLQPWHRYPFEVEPAPEEA